MTKEAFNSDFSIKDIEREAVAKSIPKVTEENIKFVINTVCKEARYDRPSVRQLFFGMCTAFTRLGMGHKVNSKDSGTGKSYLLNKVIGYFPDKYTLILQGASNKAFQHDKGKMVIKNVETGELEDAEPKLEELQDELEGLDSKTDRQRCKEISKEIKYIEKYQQKFINLDNTITAILDTPPEGLLESLMSLVSQDGEKDQEYKFVDDKLHGTAKNIDDIYRLEDHEGNEITLPDLIERYLYNPEICFKVAWDELEYSDGQLVTQESTSKMLYASQILRNHLNNS